MSAAAGLACLVREDQARLGSSQSSIPPARRACRSSGAGTAGRAQGVSGRRGNATAAARVSHAPPWPAPAEPGRHNKPSSIPGRIHWKDKEGKIRSAPGAGLAWYGCYRAWGQEGVLRRADPSQLGVVLVVAREDEARPACHLSLVRACCYCQGRQRREASRAGRRLQASSRMVCRGRARDGLPRPAGGGRRRTRSDPPRLQRRRRRRPRAPPRQPKIACRDSEGARDSLDR
jgi:hypothetical protein